MVPLDVMLIGALALLTCREWKQQKLIEELVAEKADFLGSGGDGDDVAAATDLEVKGHYRQASPLKLSTRVGNEGAFF